MKKLQEIFKGLKPKINRTISPKDGMYIREQDAHYYSVGYSAISNITAGLVAAKLSSPVNILDMGCGHGRVLRMLKAYFPKARLTACEIDSDAVDFCADTFGANKAYSDISFDKIVLSEKFDLIWCGSLLTHLDVPHWESLFSFFTKHLAKNGLLLFTTHGRYVAKVITEYDFDYGLEKYQVHRTVDDYMKSGFGYCHYPSQLLVQMGLSDYYGFAVASPSWVFSFIEKHSDLQLCSLNEAGWENHQDVYSCCYRQEMVMEEIEDYVRRLSDDIRSKLNKTNVEINSYLSEREKITKWIEIRVKEDNMPYGPRVRHILVKRVLEQLQGHSESPSSV